jgi:CO dehydrogenase maturation factor
MCPANTLIRSLLRYLLTKRDEIVIVDLVAGVEHLGRRTAEYVDIMLIVTEASLKSLETAKKINMLSKEMGIKKIFGVGNKVLNGIDKQTIVQFFEKNQIPMIGLIPYDDKIRRSDISGVLPLDYENPSSGLTHIISISEKLLDESG